MRIPSIVLYFFALICYYQERESEVVKTNRFEILDNLVESGNGYLRTSRVLEQGISKPTLAEYVSKRNMERVAQGVYLAADAWPDELYLLSLTNSRIVFSH